MKSNSALAFVFVSFAALRVDARPSARLSVETVPSAARCPSVGEVQRSVAERLGYDALRPDAAAAIDVRFQAEKAGFSARVSQRDARGIPAGERILSDEDEDCTALGEAVILTISVMLESTSLSSHKELPTRREEIPSDASPTADENLGERTKLALHPSAFRPRLRAEATASIGVAPALAPGLSLAAGIRRGFFSLDLEGHADAPAESAFSGGRVRTSLRLAELVPCGHVAFVAGCAVIGAGAIAIEGLDVTNARTENRFHALGGLRLGIEPALGQGFFFSAHADALVALTRTTAGVGARDVFTTSPFAASFAAGAGYSFR